MSVCDNEFDKNGLSTGSAARQKNYAVHSGIGSDAQRNQAQH